MSQSPTERTLWHHTDVLTAARAQRSGDLGALLEGGSSGLILTDQEQSANMVGVAAVKVGVDPKGLSRGRPFPDGEVVSRLEATERARLMSVTQPWHRAEPGRAIESYNDPSTGVLYNFVEATDHVTLRDREDPFVELRAGLWRTNPRADTFDFDHLKSLHGHLFQDVYPWAGEPRTGGMHRNDDRDHPFAMPDEFESAWEAIAEVIDEAGRWQGATREDVVRDFPAVFTAANTVHAFREGNGRTQREFMQQLAGQAGYALDWTQITRIENDRSSQIARAGDLTPLRHAFDRMAAPIQSSEVSRSVEAARKVIDTFPGRGHARAVGNDYDRPRATGRVPGHFQGQGYER